MLLRLPLTVFVLLFLGWRAVARGDVAQEEARRPPDRPFPFFGE